MEIVVGCEVCFGESADDAWRARQGMTRVAAIADESHFGVSILRCGACGQRFASVFSETIDWVGGNDPQDWHVIPVSGPEAAALVAGGEDAVERGLRELSERRYLVRWYPSDADQPTARWIVGSVMLPRHD